ncbi:TetR/AcrR family transcriptional regulator [Flavihumibacter sp. RY-1]|jgi:AcrR family transcriptional regulator|uniref:TetR/AcrR family transcriptional regulator n=1 Tax=Flavihumibacter fluminis TaxID=2909236 RepID=A0ABS9BHS7_9BACT|nr:TetR/AcrR family transcriptional regulator [Flavihumibacter fluminis]MCF1715145.1 TetR/AcrR family transcriptional regulator [Flavihumibacter fluminis]
MEQQILDSVHQVFTTQSISRYTMDDLSTQMGISKKTLYRFYPSRQELVDQVCKRVAEEYEESLQPWDDPGISNLKKLLGLISNVVGFCKKVSPDFFLDLRRHYPVQYIELNLKLEQSLTGRIQQLLQDGIQEGVFRSSLHPALVMSIWQQHLQKDFEYAAQLVNDYSKDEVFRQAVYLFLYGIIAPAAIPEMEGMLASYDWKSPLSTQTI